MPVRGIGSIATVSGSGQINQGGLGSQGSPTFVQSESSGQLGNAETLVQMQFDAPVSENDIVIAILGWEATAQDPDGPLFDDVGNEYEEFPVQAADPHRSRLYICWAAKASDIAPTLEADWDGPTGDHPSITAAEYTPAQLGGAVVMGTGNASTWDPTLVVTGVPATIISIVDTTQNGFTVPSYMNLRTFDGFSGPMRQAIADRAVNANGTYDAPISFGTAMYEGSALVLFGSSFGVTGSGKVSTVSGSGAVT